MSFKKTVICAALAMSAFSTGAFAFDTSAGTVDFTGNIVNTPCTITTTDSALTVPLTDVKVSDLTGASGKLAPTSSQFVIKLTNCTVTNPVATASVMFDGVGDTTAPNSLLSINAGSDASGKPVATGVAIQLKDNLGVVQQLHTAGTDVNIDAPSKDLTYNAQYTSTALTVTPGLANAHANFTVAYK